MMMKKMLGSRKVFIVLDDVDDIEQLEVLAGEHTWFKAGSTIIITTREEHVLVAHRVKSIHDVNLLSRTEGICLFSKYAFGRELPIEGYEELSRKVVHYAAGLPLTIKVLGSSLCGKTKCEWNDAIERLKTIPEKQTLKRLELSYIGLEHDHKEVFLEVACILKGESKGRAISILKSCGFHARFALKVLEQKSLITVSNYGCLDMHDRIEEMGRNIVRRFHPQEPQMHTRLWVEEEIENILINELGTEATTSIRIIFTNLHPAMIMKGLKKMKKLRYLYVGGIYSVSKVNEAAQYLPDALQSLYWDRYPFRSLPKTFQADKLVNVAMRRSNTSQLWKGGKRKLLNKLKFIDLEDSKLKTFDLGMTPYLQTLNLQDSQFLVELKAVSECPYLEMLNLKGCYNFTNLHMVVEYPKLKFLSLVGSKVGNLNLVLTPNLEELYLNSCNKLVHMDVECPKLKFLDLGYSKVSYLNLRMATSLEKLDTGECYDFLALHMQVKCPNLKFLNLSASKNYICLLNVQSLKFLELSGSKVSNLNLLLAPNLEELYLNRCNEFVHISVECPKLNILKLRHSKVSSLKLGSSPHLETLDLGGCTDFVELHMPIECPNLKFLNLSGSKVSHFNLGLTPRLEKLDIWECNHFVELHMPVECPNLKFLDLSGSKVNNLNLVMTPSLEKLDLEGCSDFVELHMPDECPKLKFFRLSGSKVCNINLMLTPNLEELYLKRCNEIVHTALECPKLRFLEITGSNISTLKLGPTPSLQKLNLQGCNYFVELQLSVECLNLVSLNLSGSKVSKLNLGLSPNIKWLDLKECYCLEEIHAPLGCLENLVYLNLSGCPRFKYFLVNRWTGFGSSLAKLELNAESLYMCSLHPNNNLPKFQFKCEYDEDLPSSSGNLEKLISFGLCACTNLESFSTSICGLQRLGKLKLECNIREVPKDLYRLESLEELTLSMKKVKHLPSNICMLKHLKSLNLKLCWLLEQLPIDLGILEGLKELDLTSCISLRGIPNSICNMKCLKSLNPSFCIQVKNLPGELGGLQCLEMLNIEGSGISHLPHRQFQLKDLCIVWSRWRLLSYGFTCLKEILRYTASSYVHQQHYDPIEVLSGNRC